MANNKNFEVLMQAGRHLKNNMEVFTMKKVRVLAELENAGFLIVNVRTGYKNFHQLYQIEVYKNGNLRGVLKSESIEGNQKNLALAIKETSLAEKYETKKRIGFLE